MSDLLQKIRQGEHQQQDFKYQITDSRKIARTLVAFANTNGGRLLIGVKDNGNINGVNSHEEIHMIEAAADFYSTPTIDVEYQHHKIEGKEVLEALVQPSSQKPHFVKELESKKVAYFRQDDENFPVSSVLLKLWLLQKAPPKKVSLTEKEELLLKFLNENEFITAKRFAAIAHIPIKKAEDIITIFLYWKVLSWTFNGTFFTYSLRDSHPNK